MMPRWFTSKTVSSQTSWAIPDCPTNKGKICIRSISSIMGLYNPYRVKVL